MKFSIIDERRNKIMLAGVLASVLVFSFTLSSSFGLIFPKFADAQTASAAHATTLKLSAGKLNVGWGLPLSYTATLTDNALGGAPVAGSTITIVLASRATGAGSGEVIGSAVTDANGQAIFGNANGGIVVLAPITIANGWTVQAKFAGNDQYTASDSPVRTFNTVAHKTTLTLGAVKASVAWGQPNTFTATLKDASNGNAPVAGMNIVFANGGNGGNSVTDANGKATFATTAPDIIATGWTVQAKFAGDSLYTASDSAVKTYNTVAHKTTLTVAASKASVGWGQPITFTATLKDASNGNAPVAGMNIVFAIGGNGGDANGVTDANGKATFATTAPDIIATGWTVQAKFAGDSLYTASDSAVKTYSTVKHKTSLTLVVSPANVQPGQTFNMSGVLKDTSAGGIGLAAKPITITADSPITISDTTTDSAGKYSVNAAYDPSTNSITARFAGDELYQASFQSSSIPSS